MNKEEYRIKTPDFLQAAACYDGFEFIARAREQNWKPIPSWGRDGYDLGNWPYVIILCKKDTDAFYIAYYVEGDITIYKCPSPEIRNSIIDEIAFWHWNNDDEKWVAAYKSVEELPAELKGPYRR